MPHMPFLIPLLLTLAALKNPSQVTLPLQGTTISFPTDGGYVASCNDRPDVMRKMEAKTPPDMHLLECFFRTDDLRDMLSGVRKENEVHVLVAVDRSTPC
jgi:hypothetical protein